MVHKISAVKTQLLSIPPPSSSSMMECLTTTIVKISEKCITTHHRNAATSVEYNVDIKTYSRSNRNAKVFSNLFPSCFAYLFIFIVLLFDGIPIARVRGKGIDLLRDDLVCNLSDEHECICNRSRGDLDHSESVPCYEFLKVKRLEAVSIVMRDINLRSRLHTNESFELYFRRRIANILSQYCDNMPSECPGTFAALRQNKQNSAQIEANNGKTTTFFNNDPVFTRENVIILRVTYPPGKSRTELAFVVTKQPDTIYLNTTLILDPTTVKYILSAQMAPLSRVLGGVRIEQFGIDVIEKPSEPVDNTRLLIMVGIIGSSMFICCAIAAVRQFCLFQQTRSERSRNNKDTSTAPKSTRNYGTCTEKFFSNYDLSNGRTKTKSISRESNSSKKTKKRWKKNSNCSSEIPTAAVIIDEVSTRPYQNIFVCDHSQLPKEEEDEEFKLEIQETKRQSLKVRSPRSPFSSDEDASGSAFHGFQFPDRFPSNEERRPSIPENNIPSVILDEELSNGRLTSKKLVAEGMMSEKMVMEVGGFLSAINEDHPYERPLSRRGSINEEIQEGGEEEGNDTREDTPVPIGDDQNAAVVVEKPLIVVLRKRNKAKIIVSNEENETEEEEEEENALYQPLREEWKEENNKEEQLNSTDSERTRKKRETDMLERHQYERLLESPMLPLDQQTDVQNDKTRELF